MYSAWAIENNEPAEFESLPPDELNTVLAKFWSEVRKSNGDYYGRNSLFNLRAMINKHLKGMFSLCQKDFELVLELLMFSQ